MINFRCPKCDDWISVDAACAGQKEACPGCGNVCVAPAVSEAPPRTVALPPGRGPRPAFPAALKWAIGLYAATIALSVVSGVAGSQAPPPALSEQEMAGFVVVSCVALLLLPADILGLVFACLGYRWGAILCAGTTGLSFVIAIPVYAHIEFGVIDGLGSVAALGSLACLFLPDSLNYYRAMAEYRRAGASTPGAGG